MKTFIIHLVIGNAEAGKSVIGHKALAISPGRSAIAFDGQLLNSGSSCVSQVYS